MSDEGKRLGIAMALTAVVLFGWQALAPKFFPEMVEKQKTQVSTDLDQANKNNNFAGSNSQNPGSSNSANNSAQVGSADNSSLNSSVAGQEKKVFTLKNPLSRVVVNSHLGIEDFWFHNNETKFKNIVGDDFSAGVYFLNQSGQKKQVYFNLSQESETRLVGLSPEGTQIEVNLLDSGAVEFNLSKVLPKAVQWRILATPGETESGLQRRKFLYFSNELADIEVGSEGKSNGKLRWAGLDFNYHFFGISWLEPKMADLQARPLNEINGELFTQVRVTDADTNFKWNVLFAKKEHQTLVGFGNNLDKSVDFGFFSFLAQPILQGLRFFYTLFPNYGIAIILLTLIIRLLTFPLQYKSVKSMKKMQKIQPDLARIRERFKDNPQKMQQETMAMFKREGANPLSGCFPLLLQMPIFFAFYQVLQNSVELVSAPFYFWISDLSLKDPYYVLPVLMTIAMFAQQKITPSTTADPTQKKVLMAMPLIFGFIMKEFPSGLSLYIFVSTLFGVVQQVLIFRRVS